jgi:glycosyltransferase involved in cell wall biosynthesis
MKKKPYSVGYFSAYYRGLECLLDMWPAIKFAAPRAKLDIYYGWESWVKAEGNDDLYHRVCDKLEALKDQGVTEHGRVSHEKLAQAMLKTEVWAYPTQFEEINCITALKANAAGMKPVITDVGALKETGGPNATFIETARIYSDDYSKSKFVKAVVEALHNPQDAEAQQNQRLWVEQYTWDKIAKSWAEVIK